MTRKLKVYGWQGWRTEAAKVSSNGRQQTREIVAAASKAEVARLVGVNRPAQVFNLDETGNEQEVLQAMSKPGAVFWRPLDQRHAERSWQEASR